MPRFSSAKRLAVPAGRSDHVQGPAEAPLTLVMYGDYECPWTRVAVRIVARVREEVGAQLRFVYRSFPLVDIHPHALQAAEAAEAANAQGRFWEMHELLFRNRYGLGERYLRGFAKELNLDVRRFVHELDEHAHLRAIGETVAGGVASGVEGTPTLFINGYRYSPYEVPVDYSALLDRIRVRSHRRRAKLMLPGPVPRKA